jgi:2-methylcitrate dehydratase PrpD
MIHPQRMEVGEQMQDSSGRVAHSLAAFITTANAALMPTEVITKAKTCLIDFLACVFEAHELPWGKQAIEYASFCPSGPSTVLGTNVKTAATEAAFVNGALGHSLLREDMHVAAKSHLGVVVWPALLALAEMNEATGEDLLAAAIVGYEVGGRIGRALFDDELAGKLRPTGTVGPLAAAAAGARLLGLNTEQTVAALGFAANAACGVNEWSWAAGTEVFFHAAFAARSAVTAVLLARTGAFASPTAIDGRAGLFAAYDRRERARFIVPLGDGNYEINSVYWKPAPACNFVQSPCQAALKLVEKGVNSADIEKVTVRTFHSAIEYPGCNNPGPFPGVLAAKMSIQYSVAATLVRGAIEETNYAQPADSRILDLAKKIELVADPEFQVAFPGKQGTTINVILRNGLQLSETRDDIRSLDAAMVRSRFKNVAAVRFNGDSVRAMLSIIDDLGSGGRPGVLAATTMRP